MPVPFEKMVEWAYNVTPVHPSASLSVSEVSNSRFKFFRRGPPCPLDTFLVEFVHGGIMKNTTVLMPP